MKSGSFQVRAGALLVLAALLPACGGGSSSGGGSVAGGTPAIVVLLTGASTTDESGASTTVSISLATDPTDDVVIALSLSDPSEASLSGATLSGNSLTFSPGSATTAQVVTVTGKDDADVDGDVDYDLVIDAASSTDVDYDTLDPADIPLTNLDNEVVTPGIVVTPTTQSGGLTLLTSEFGQSDTFKVRLGSPLSTGGQVTVTIAGLNTDEGTLSTTTLDFTDADAQDFKIVTVTGIEEAAPAADGNVEYTLTLSAANTGLNPADDTYNAVPDASVVVVNFDRDGLSAPGSGSQSAPTPAPGIAGGSSAFNAFETDDPTVVMNGASGNQFEMWFRGRTSGGVKTDAIGRATSFSDPAAFTADFFAVLSGNGDDWVRRGVGKPSVLFHDFDNNNGGVPDSYRMFLSGRFADHDSIGTATSTNGSSNWQSTLNGPIFSATGVDLDWDEVRVFDPCVILDSGTYHMWYTGEDATGLLQIGYATAPDAGNGVPGAWTRQNLLAVPALPVGPAGSIDEGGVSAPAVVKDGATYHMWYTAHDLVRGRKTIAYASSTNPADFSAGKFPVPIVAPDQSGVATWSDENVFSPAVVKDGALYRIWYAGSGTGGRGIGYVEGN